MCGVAEARDPLVTRRKFRGKAARRHGHHETDTCVTRRNLRPRAGRLIEQFQLSRGYTAGAWDSCLSAATGKCTIVTRRNREPNGVPTSAWKLARFLAIFSTKSCRHFGECLAVELGIFQKTMGQFLWLSKENSWAVEGAWRTISYVHMVGFLSETARKVAAKPSIDHEQQTGAESSGGKGRDRLDECNKRGESCVKGERRETF